MRNRDVPEPGLVASPARRKVSWAVAIALLVNVFTIMPLMLRMAGADEAMVATTCPMHGTANKGDADRSSIDHSHCLVCTGGIGAAMLAAGPTPDKPTTGGDWHAPLVAEF